MVAITRTPRSRWIEEGLRALAAGGPDAIRVEVLAQALGVTKGGFYGHFADRNALLEEMLDCWERMSIDEVLERVERQGGDARAKVRLAGALTFSRELPQLVDRLQVPAVDDLVEEPAHDGDRVAGAAPGRSGLLSGRHRERPG